jgi:hypothetical protein
MLVAVKVWDLWLSTTPRKEREHQEPVQCIMEAGAVATIVIDDLHEARPTIHKL